ncbi:MAG: peptide-methionine (S)-S-oxide reductase MsrA [Caulobacteraceae bacterium]
MSAALFRRLAALVLIAVALAFPLLSATRASAAAAKLDTAIFAGGCFWCMETDMKAIPGVVSVESGYTGGTLKNPTYQDVISETTGHYESVRVKFDPKQITYRQLLDRYWKLVDPTDNGGQFCDRGPSYRPVVFVNGPAQQKAAEESRAAAAKILKTGRMVTPILPATTFYPAEEYHRDYAKRHALSYEMYRTGCGRDARLADVWGRAAG